MNGCLNRSDSCWPTLRASMSVVPPAENATTTCTGLLGYDSAFAIMGMAIRHAAASSRRSAHGYRRIETSLNLYSFGRFDQAFCATPATPSRRMPYVFVVDSCSTFLLVSIAERPRTWRRTPLRPAAYGRQARAGA